MKLKHIFIKNFKKFKKITQPLQRFSILLGENDSGKSTILQAINILLSYTEKIDRIFIPNLDEETVIGGLFELNDGSLKFLKKTFTKKTFKLDEDNSDLVDLNNIDFHLVYISCETLDPKKLCADLALARAKERTTEETLATLQNTFDEAIKDTIDSIDENLLVIDKFDTTLVPSADLKFDSFVKYTIKVNGVDIDARGSGFKKNLAYALIAGGSYENVLLVIDEIENSFSPVSVKKIMNAISNNYNQSVISTHSPEVVKNKGVFELIPLFNDFETDSVFELFKYLGSPSDLKFLLVEGVYDINWLKKAFNILNVTDNYIILPAGGCGNIGHIKTILEQMGFLVKTIYDGDTNFENCLSKDCIEMYTPIEKINELFGLSIAEMPNNKEALFNLISPENVRSKDTAKEIISNNVFEFLNDTNPIIQEIATILE